MKKTIIALVTAVVLAAAMMPAAFAGEASELNSLEKPEKVTVKAVGYKTVKISWKSSENSAHHDLYRYNNKKKKYCRVAAGIKGTSYTYKNVKTGLVYRFKLKASETVDGVTFESGFTDAVKVKTFFKKPAAVTAKGISANKTLIKWSKVKGAKGYSIYRYVKSKKKYVRVGRTGAKTRSFTDKGLSAASTYKYKVRGIKKIRLYNGKKYSVIYAAGRVSDPVKAKTKSYKKKLVCKITAYCDSGYTASGLKAGKGRVAVDPSVIPLGSKMYVSGYGECVAADTGGAVKGNFVDIWLPDNSSCNSWGVQYRTVYVY